MTPEQQAAQQAHAEQIKLRTEQRRQTPEQRDTASLEAMVTRIATQVAMQIVSKIALQNGQNVTISGAFPNWTITANVPQTNQGQGQNPVDTGQWGPQVTTCDGTKFEPWVRNIIPPP